MTIIKSKLRSMHTIEAKVQGKGEKELNRKVVRKHKVQRKRNSVSPAELVCNCADTLLSVAQSDLSKNNILKVNGEMLEFEDSTYTMVDQSSSLKPTWLIR